MDTHGATSRRSGRAWACAMNGPSCWASTAWTTPKAFPSGCGPSTGFSSAIPSGATASSSSRWAHRAGPKFASIVSSTTRSSEITAQINVKHGTGDWNPICLARAHHGVEEVFAGYRAASVCVVSSLHDGMNLVAKEFVAARDDRQGVLILSPFTGAAREMPEALLVNPYATDAFADALNAALTMPPEEQQRRMQRLRRAGCRAQHLPMGRSAPHRDLPAGGVANVIVAVRDHPGPRCGRQRVASRR